MTNLSEVITSDRVEEEFDGVSPSIQTSPAVPNKPRFWGRFGQAICAVFFALFLCECFARVIYVVGQYNPLVSDEFLVKKQLAEAPSQKPVVAYMGTSYTATSIYSDLLAAVLQKHGIDCDVRNLALLGMGGVPEVQLQLLRSATDSGNKPAIVFYDVSPLVGHVAARFEGKRELSRYCPYLFTYRDRLARLLRSLPSILATPEATSAGGFGVHVPPNSAKGWNPKLEALDQQSLANSLQIRHGLAEKHQAPALFVRPLEEFQNYCSQHDIRLVFVWYPTTPQSDEVFKSVGPTPDEFVALWKNTAQSWHAKFLNIHGQLDSSYFADCDHVNAAGAYLITEKMVPLISSAQFQDALRDSKK